MYGDEIASKQLQEIIRDALGDELGKFKNGRPACTVEPPKAPDFGSGLHVVIDRFPSKITRSTYQWKITLRQYDRSDSGIATFERAIAILRSVFPLSSYTVLPFQEDAYPQSVFRVDAYQYFQSQGIAIDSY